MPASNKMLKAREHAKNREAGIGDAQGRLPSRVKAANVMGQCTKCMASIRMTNTNTEAKDHWNSRHGTFTFAECFPGQFDPTAAVEPPPVDASAAPAQVQNAPKKDKKKEDLSFLAEALAVPKGSGGKGGKKK